MCFSRHLYFFSPSCLPPFSCYHNSSLSLSLSKALSLSSIVVFLYVSLISVIVLMVLLDLLGSGGFKRFPDNMKWRRLEIVVVDGFTT